MESTTVRTDFCKNEKGEHVIVRTTTRIVKADEKDETISTELHDSTETVPYEPAERPSIDQAREASKVGRPAEDRTSNWIDDSGGGSAAANWPEEVR